MRGSSGTLVLFPAGLRAFGLLTTLIFLSLRTLLFRLILGGAALFLRLTARLTPFLTSLGTTGLLLTLIGVHGFS